MTTRAKAGFNVIELAVVTVVVVLLALAVMPACSTAFCGANGTAVGARGKDIYVSIIGANTERAAVGLPPVWPSDSGSQTSAADKAVSCFNFTNSTDYFAYLNDAEHLGTERWNPRVAGFDYTKLSGGGVPACQDGHLTAACNMWTIAKNVRDDLPDIVPVLVTRNVDVSSLAARVSESDWDKSLRFDPYWETPFGHRLISFIRKGGAIFKVRERYLSYGVVYQSAIFDTAVDEAGQSAARPFKYLTPTHEVVPSEQVYQAGAVADKARVRRIETRLTRDARALRRLGLPVGLGVGVLYLVAAWVYGAVRFFRHAIPFLRGVLIAFGVFHWAAVTLYAVFLFGLADQYGYPPYWTHLALAVLAQGAGIAFVVRRAGCDRALRTRGVKWMVAAPLLVFGFAMSTVIIVFLVVSIDRESALCALGVLATLVIVVTTLINNIGRGRCTTDDHEPQDNERGGAA